MAAAHCTTTTFHLHFTTTTAKFTKKPLRLISYNYIPTPKRSAKRRNYLHQKLLKTLTKPPSPNSFTSQPHPTDSEITLLPSAEKDSNFPSSDQFSGEPSRAVADEEVKELESRELEQSEASESVEIVSGNVGNFPKDSAMKFGFWLVGAFVFQTICAVWVFGSADFDEKFRGLESKNEKIDKGDVLERGVNGNDDSRLKLHVNGEVGFENKGNLYINEDEMVKKIEEIKVLAREARERERVERKKNGLDGSGSDFEDEEEEDGFGKSDIEKEVFERLQKLRTTLEKDRMAYLKGDGERKDGVGKKGNEGLLFKKKYKFKGLLSEQRDRAKGFSGVSDHIDGKMRGSFNSENEVLNRGDEVDGGVNMLDDKQGSQRDLHEGNLSRSAAMDFKGNRRREGKSEASKSLKTVKEQEGRKVDSAESKPPKVQDKNYGRLSVETGNSRETSMVVSDRHDQSLHGHKQSATTKKIDCETNWWLGLPYVLVILMQIGREGEGQRGLYTLKGSSYTDDESSQFVAFADRGDATNFCYLLQSSFEDLGDFSTDVVPLSIKELKEVMKSVTKKVIVVKQGQLQLYAGQPLADVEMALRSLVEQSS